MKSILFCLLLAISCTVCAQTIDNPPFKARNNSIRTITRIERSAESTRLHIHAVFRPKWWIQVSSDNYLEDARTGKRYKLLSAEGFELDKKVFMPESGEKDFVLIFEPLPKETESVHFIGPNCNECNTYDISLLPANKNKSPLEAVRGNWYADGEAGRWEFGIYDSITIMQNRIYTNESIRKKRKRVELTIKDRLTGERSLLWLAPQKDGKCQIQLNDDKAYTYTKEVPSMPCVAADEGFGEFFRTDSACFQGYIDGYDRRLGFETSVLYLRNELTDKDYPTVVSIEPDGTFQCKFLLEYPVSTYMRISNTNYTFFIEPGQTLTMYIDWEECLNFNRSRDYNYPIRNTAYMGPSASLSRLKATLKENLSTPINSRDAQKKFTPQQYREYLKPFIARKKQTCDSLMQLYAPSKKAIRLIKNEPALQAGNAYLEFLMYRDYLAKEDTANAVLKVKTTDADYDFLKATPLNDEAILARSSWIFINRFEFMRPLQKAYNLVPRDILQFYPTKPFLSFLKEKGVKLNAQQDSIRLKHEALAGTVQSVSMSKLQAEATIIRDLYKEETLLAEYVKLYEAQNKQIHQEAMQANDEARTNALYDLKVVACKDSIINNLCGTPNPLVWQIAKLHGLHSRLENVKSKSVMREYTNQIKQGLTHPILIATAEQMFAEKYPQNGAETSYQLPKGKATDIFRNIIKEHAGKVLFVDFWATTCGPCRAGIEATAELRKKYKDHPEFKFIYITGEKESPKGAYNAYVEKHLKGEACYYVSGAEFDYLRQLFRFNGIPHYELVEKDGSIATDCPDSYELGDYLEKRFK